MLTTPQLLAAIDSVTLESSDVQMELLSDYGEILDIYDVEVFKNKKEEEKERKMKEKYGENKSTKSKKDSTKVSAEKINEDKLRHKFSKKVERSATSHSKSKIAAVDVLESVTLPDTINSLVDIIKAKHKVLSLIHI